MSEPSIHPAPNGDVDISVDDAEVAKLARGEQESHPEPSVDPRNIEHPEEVLGE